MRDGVAPVESSQYAQKPDDNKSFRKFGFVMLALFLMSGGIHLVGGHSWGFLFFLFIPLMRFKGQHKIQGVMNNVRSGLDRNTPVTLAEADALGAGTEPLEAGYSELLRTVLGAQSLSPSAQRNVHESLRDIGDLVAKLSGDPFSSIMTDPVKIQRQAEETEERARLETDPVVAASLQRQSETLRGSAALAGQRATLRRRREAARGEVVTQIQSMQVSLESHTLSGEGEQSDFAGLSASIQQIAAEVNATLSAREEVRSAIDPRYQEPPQNTQNLGR